MLRRRRRVRMGTVYERHDPNYCPPKSVRKWVEQHCPLITISDEEEEEDEDKGKDEEEM